MFSYNSSWSVMQVLEYQNYQVPPVAANIPGEARLQLLSAHDPKMLTKCKLTPSLALLVN